MKTVRILCLLAAIILLTGCATISRPYSREFSLVTTPKDSPGGRLVSIDSTILNKGDYSGAIQAYKKAFELDRDDDLALWLWSNAAYNMGKYDEALSLINKAIDIKNYGMMGMRIKIEGVARSSFNITDSVETIKRKTNEEDWVTEACYVIEVERDSAADKAGLKVGDKLIGIDKIKLLDHSVAANSTKTFFENYIKAKAPGTPVEVFRQGDKKSTTVILGRFKDPFLAYKLGLKSMLLARIGNMDAAFMYATESLNHNLSDNQSKSLAKVALGSIHIHNGNYDEAIKLLSGVVKSSATARLLEATAYAKQGDFNKAVDIYSSIPEEKLTPKDVPLWSDRTALLDTLKPFIASIMESAGKLKAQGRYREALKELGDAMKIADDAETEAISRAISEIIGIAPSLSVIPEEARKYALRGDVMTEEGKFEDAVKEYRKAVQAAPYIAKLYFNTAMLYGELKKLPQAIRYMKTYLNLAPEAPNARAAQDQIYKWEFKMEKGNKG